MEKRKEALARLEQSLHRLKEALSRDISEDPLYLDATVQRFEFTFEMAWKAIRTFAEHEGLECRSPRGCIKLAYSQGWLKDEEGWIELLEARNLTSHTYDQETALKVYKTIKKRHRLFEDLLSSLGGHIDQ